MINIFTNRVDKDHQFLYPNYQAKIQRAGSYGPRQLAEFIYYSEKQSKEGASGVATSIHSPRSMDGSMLSSLGGESPSSTPSPLRLHQARPETGSATGDG